MAQVAIASLTILQKWPTAHCESMVQNGCGRVSTRQTPWSHIWPVPQVASVVQAMVVGAIVHSVS